MKNDVKIIVICMLFLMASQLGIAQEEPSKIIKEEESSEVYLEEYTDEFQETFFEAIKQKGIQNYDRTINLLLECKSMGINTVVVDHELAKAYFLDKKYVQAQKYAIEALVSEPKNYWYLDTLVTILQKQSNSMEAVKSSLPFDDEKLRENLALIYYKKNNYNRALKILNGMPPSNFKTELVTKITDAKERFLEQEENKPKTVTIVNGNNESTTRGLEINLKNQIKLGKFRIVERTAKDALETYPLQPYFYYAYGLALHKNNKNNQAIEILESSLDYLFDDVALANKVYKTLSDAYTKINNFSKANLYLSKIKPGF